MLTIRLGNRGETLHRFAHEQILELHDLAPFVHEQAVAASPGSDEDLWCPVETVLSIGAEGGSGPGASIDPWR